MVAQTSHFSVKVLQQNIANKLNNNIEDIELVNLLNNYSESLRLYNQDFAKSLEYCEIAKTISENLKYAEGLADSLLNIGTCFVYMNDKIKPERYLKKSLGIYRKLKNSKGEAQSLIILGAAKLVSENYVEAYDFVETGLNLCILTNYQKGQIIANYKLAQISEKLQDYDATIKFCKKALSISDDYDIKVRIHTLIGSTLLLRSEIKEAKDFFEQAIVNLKSYEDKLSLARISIELGKIALIEENHQEANEYFDNGLSLFDEMGLLEHSADSYIEISDAYIEEKDSVSALSVLKQFHDLTQTDEEEEGYASVLMKMASIKIQNGKSYEALNLLKQVWEIVGEGENLNLQYQCQEAYSTAFQSTENFQEALEHHKRFFEYKKRFDQQKAELGIKRLTHRIRIEKQRELKQLATLKNMEIAQTIYEVHEKSNALFEAEEAISNLKSENEMLHISNSGCTSCSTIAIAA